MIVGLNDRVRRHSDVRMQTSEVGAQEDNILGVTINVMKIGYM